MASAKWMARRPVAWSICSPQLNPSETINVSGSVRRTAGKEHSFSYGLRYRELLFLKAEWAGHSATPGIERLQGGSHLSEQRLLVFHFHERFVMAMTVKDDFSMKLRRFIARSMMFQKFTEEECLAAKPIGARVIRKQVSQFIAEYRGATRLQDHDRQSGVDLRTQAMQNVLEILPGFIEHAEVIQRPPAAEVILRELLP